MLLKMDRPPARQTFRGSRIPWNSSPRIRTFPAELVNLPSKGVAVQTYFRIQDFAEKIRALNVDEINDDTLQKEHNALESMLSADVTELDRIRLNAERSKVAAAIVEKQSELLRRADEAYKIALEINEGDTSYGELLDLHKSIVNTFDQAEDVLKFPNMGKEAVQLQLDTARSAVDLLFNLVMGYLDDKLKSAKMLHNIAGKFRLLNDLHV